MKQKGDCVELHDPLVRFDLNVIADSHLDPYHPYDIHKCTRL